MTKIISKEERVKELLDFGFPKVFIENIGDIPELQYRVGNTDGAYFYLPTLLNYKILRGKKIVPVFDCGESFTVLIIDHESEHIIKFELENDEIYIDYEKNVDLLLMDIMIDYFDDHIDDEIDLDHYISTGSKIGFKKSEDLFHLRNLPIYEYNSKSEDVENWRIEIAEKLKIL